MTPASLKAPVSVVIPCFRCANTIERAVISAVTQTLVPAEIILIDDASGDSTLEKLYELKNKLGDIIQVIGLSTNVGAGSARNIGWCHATQPYIAFLDSDDAWHPQKIEIQYNYMESNLDVMLTGHTFKLVTDSNAGFANCPAKLDTAKKITLAHLLIKNPFVTPSVMLRAKIKSRFTDGSRHVEDHRLWLEIAIEKMVIVKLNSQLAAIYKPNYGASGLSSNMWLMEKAELSNYRYFYNKGKLLLPIYVFLQCFSFIKFVKRILIVHVVRRIK